MVDTTIDASIDVLIDAFNEITIDALIDISISTGALPGARVLQAAGHSSPHFHIL